MDFLYVIFGMTTVTIFLYHREWLLNRRSSQIILFVNILFYLLSSILEEYSIGEVKKTSLLKMPIMAQYIFNGMDFVFRKMYNRSAVDTFWTMDLSLMKDGIFNALFWIFGILLPLFYFVG